MHSEPTFQGQPDRLIDSRERENILGFSRSTCLRKEKAGEIPPAVIVDGNVKRFSFNETQAYVQRKKQERDARLAGQAADQLQGTAA